MVFDRQSFAISAVTLLRDASNTLRSFFGTNILTMSWAFSILGAALGPTATIFCAFVVYRATLSLIRVKQSLPGHATIVSYGAVVSAIGGGWMRVVVDCLVMFTQFATCVSYTAFSSKNLHNISHLDYGYCIIILVTIVCGISMFHNPYMLAKISIVTNLMMFTGIGVVLTTIDCKEKDAVSLALPAGLPIGLASLSSSLGGITTVLDVERTMTDRPGRYLRLLRVVLPLAVIFLATVGTVGYLTFGAQTCSVLSLSLHEGSWQQKVANTVLTIGPSLEGVLNSFPLFVLTERYACKTKAIKNWSTRHPYLFLAIHRIVGFACAAGIAFGVPFFGYITSINGAVGYASLSFLVPVVCEVLRSRTSSFDNLHREIEENEEIHNRSITNPPPLLSDIQNASKPVFDDVNPSFGHPSNDPATLSADQKAEAIEHLRYNLSGPRKLELLFIFVFGVFVVVAGTVSAVKDIADSLSGTSNATSC